MSVVFGWVGVSETFEKENEVVEIHLRSEGRLT